MTKPQPPELNRFMDKRVKVGLVGNYTIIGVLSGFDSFMNIVLDEGVMYNINKPSETLGQMIVRGNNILLLEAATA
ncbi:hypothetical protein A3Q56_06141 [Intoshia linei]|uniref:Sm protein G n=1 Tax=Intoshia linei TaxID=1819745 RepID=A0A177AVS8_9BILA|nr:hypothetical protein A3Q56_06141 [Intoshia linei]